jgi:Ca2+-binding RTX toxin-like protein
MNLALTAQLAQAAYGTFPNGITGAELARALELPVAGFTLTQARDFAATHTVVLQYNDDAPGSGGNGTSLSLTVFKDKSGHLALAVRGTLEFGDLAPTDRNILLEGAGYDQIAALYSWWMRASNLRDTKVAQYAVNSGRQGDADALVLPDGSFLVRRADASATGELATSLSTDADRRIDVTGHSLGGHLAMAFGAMFGASTGSVTVFNAPGFLETSTNSKFFARLGGAALPNGNNAINVIANEAAERDVGAAGFKLIAGLHSRPGLAVDVPIEDQWLSDEPDPARPARNHSQVVLADSLAVKALLDQFTPSLDFAAYRKMFNEASNVSSASLERVLESMRRLLLRKNEVLPSGNSQREALYVAMSNLQASSAFQTLSGKVLLESSDKAVATKARTDFGSLASLLSLSPLVIKTNDIANQSLLDTVLAGTWGQTYANWLADKALSTAQRAFGQATYSDAWFADRASMLGYLVLRNQTDVDVLIPRQAMRVTAFSDVAQRIAFDVGIRGGITKNPYRVVAFGADTGDSITGARIDDRLYGGEGNDTLIGLDGNDYLEGNAGDDVLEGGRGNDVMVGGAGSDRFIVGFNHGFDRVIGADAGDRVELDGRSVTGAGRWRSRVGSVTVWIDDSATGQAVRYVHDASRQTLIVSGAGSAVQVFDFQSGDLGIVVPTSPVVAPPPADTPRFDLAIDDDRQRWDAARVSDGTSAVRVVNAYGLTFGNVASGAGDDVLAGGARPPVRQTFLSGGSGADRIYAGDERPIDDAIAAGEVGTGSRRGVVMLAGDAGDDEIAAGEGADVIFGGDGSDTLVAGAGDDIIFADGNNVGAMTTLGLNNDPVTGEATWVFGRNDPRTAEPMRLNLALHLARRGLTVSNSAGQRTEVFESLVATLNPLSDIDLSGLLAMSRDSVGPASGEVRVFAEGSQRSYRDLTGGGFFGSNVGSGNDVIYAGAGDDVVNAGAGDDIVYAGAGNDMVSGYDGNDQIDGGDGNDRIYGDHAASVRVGVEATETRNVFSATYTVRNTLDASRHGRDRLDGGAGNDIVIGGGADDDIEGGDGDDFLYGDDIGIDELFAGDDRVDGGAGNDTMYGGAGNDELIGGTGDDKLYGEVGDDLISGGEGADLLAGGEGNDELDGGAGRDALFGGDGNDTLVSDGDDLLDGGAGDDAYLLSLRPLRNRLGTFEVSSIVQDASGRSTLAMQGGPGSIGEFSVVNRAGQVLLLAGTAGAVQIGDAVDFDQTDVVTVSGERATLAELVARDDASAVGSGAGGAGSGGIGSAGGTGAATGAIRSVEADGRSVLLSTALLTANQTLWGSARADRLEGGTGGDAMDGGRGNDWLTGGDGADDLTGGTGSDVLVGGAGSDTLRGGDRNGASAAGDVDTYVFNLGDGFDTIMAKRNVAAPTDVIRFGAGITRADLRVGVSPAPYTPEVQLIDLAYGASDRVSLDFGADLQIAHVEFADGTRVSLGELITSRRPASTDGDDRMDGTRFDDALSGGAGNDMLDGRGGDDVLSGGAGEDTIDGRDGDDVLTGGPGDDVLTGGSGRNTYVFGADSGRDRPAAVRVDPCGTARFAAWCRPGDRRRRG